MTQTKASVLDVARLVSQGRYVLYGNCLDFMAPENRELLESWLAAGLPWGLGDPRSKDLPPLVRTQKFLDAVDLVGLSHIKTVCWDSSAKKCEPARQ